MPLSPLVRISHGPLALGATFGADSGCNIVASGAGEAQTNV